MSDPRKTFGKLTGVEVYDEHGKKVARPTIMQVRQALLKLIEDSGAQVIQMQVDGLLCAFVMPGGDEIPDENALEHSNHMITIAEHYLKAMKAVKGEYLGILGGGSA